MQLLSFSLVLGKMWGPVAWETKETTSIAVLISGSLKPGKWEEVAVSCLQAQNPKPCLSPVVSTSMCSLIRTVGEPAKHKRTEPRTNYCSAPAHSMQPHALAHPGRRSDSNLSRDISKDCHSPVTGLCGTVWFYPLLLNATVTFGEQWTNLCDC